MRKKILLVTLCVIFALTCLASLSACSENTKQDAIATEIGGGVYSNGGLAVVYGKYLYFINGLAEATDDNFFGEVVKGSIARVELDANKNPLADTYKIVVPKKVYGTDTTTTNGLYIVDDYIYYTTTSLDKDKNGEYKTSELVLMRTKVDGTDTKVIKKFEGDSIIYKVGKGFVLLFNSTESTISRIDLSTKKFKETTVVEEVESGPIFTTVDNDGNDKSMNNYLFYQKAGKESEYKDIYVISVDKSIENGKELITDAIIKDKDSIAKEKDSTFLYGATLSNVVYTENNTITVFYSLKDSLLNAPYSGLYSCKFDANFNYAIENVVRYTYTGESVSEYNYKSKDIVDDKVLLFTGKRLDIYNLDGTFNSTVWTLAADVTPYKFQKFSGEKSGLYLIYVESDVYKAIKVFGLDESNKVVQEKDAAQKPIQVQENALKMMTSKVKTTWCPAEIIYGNMYFFGASVESNIGYFPFDVNTVPEIGEDDEREMKLLGEIVDEDKQALAGTAE